MAVCQGESYNLTVQNAFNYKPTTAVSTNLYCYVENASGVNVSGNISNVRVLCSSGTTKIFFFFWNRKKKIVGLKKKIQKTAEFSVHEVFTV